MTAHRKIVSRQIAKQYLQGTKEGAYRYLADTAYFTNDFQNTVMEQDVLPWLTGQATQYIIDLYSRDNYPDQLLMGYFDEAEAIHAATVATEKARREKVRLLNDEHEREKIA